MGDYTQDMVDWLMELGVGEKVARSGVAHHEKALRERIAQDILAETDPEMTGDGWNYGMGYAAQIACEGATRAS